MRFGDHDLQRGQRGGGNRGRSSRRVDIRPRPIDQPLDQQPAAADESAGAAQGLAERADAGGDGLFHAEMLGHAAAAGAEHARGVGLVHQQHGLVPPGHLGKLGQRRQVAVHAEQAVGDDQAAAVARRPGQERVELLPIGMRVGADIGPGKPAAVPEAGMILGIAEDDVAGAGQGGDGGQVGGEAGRKEQRRLRAFELRQALFQPLMRLGNAR